MREIPRDIINYKSCNNADKLCYHLKPYSYIDIASENENTKKEKQQHVDRYKNTCDNKSGIIQQCCSKNEEDILKLDSILKKLKNPPILGKVEYNKQGELESIELCEKDSLRSCGKNFKKLNSYEMCKIPKDMEKSKEIITKFNKDCYNAQCNPQERLADINGKYDDEYTYEFDKEVVSSIINDNLDNFKIYLEKDPKLKDRVLTHTAEGNTIYHESFKHNAKHIIVYIFKTITQQNINKLNSNGETVLHMAMKTDNPNAIQLCIKMGANINAINNHNETPIFNAIRNDIYYNVLVCLNNHTDLKQKNKKGETPFIVSCTCKKRNIDIVRLLTDKGANIDDKNKDNKTMLQVILEKEELNDKKKDKKDKKKKKDLDLNIEDEKIRTHLQNIKVKKMGLDLSKPLSVQDTKKLEGILYTVYNKIDKTDKTDDEFHFTLEVNYNDELKYPDDLFYPDNIGEKFIQPYRTGDKQFSHEPYYLKYKNMHKDKLNELKKTIQLTKWDNRNTKEKKIQIIDDIMTGKLSFDKYKYKVFTDNNISQEQEHLFENLDDVKLFEFEQNSQEKKIKTIGKRENNKNTDKEKNTLVNINYDTNKKLNNESKKISFEDIFSPSETEEYNEILNSNLVKEEVKLDLLGNIKKIIDEIKNKLTPDNKKLNDLKNDVNSKVKKKKMDILKLKHNRKRNLNFLLLLGILFCILIIAVLIYLNYKKNLNFKFLDSIKKYN
tara:strand:- start:234 stop:2402 length:2169 start_codon:yes stop_codon:yes gene_type:complete